MIVALGSSSVEPGSPLISALSEQLGTEVTAGGVRGSRVAQWRDWCEEGSHGTRDGAIMSAAMVLVLLGGNDAHVRAGDVGAVDASLRAAGARAVVWIPPPPYLRGSVAYGRDRAMRAALRTAGVAFVRRPVSLTHAQYAGDLVHPTRAGYGAWARTIAPEIRSYLGLARGAGYGGSIALAALTFLAARAVAA